MNTKMQRQNVLENKKNSVDVSQNLNSIYESSNCIIKWFPQHTRQHWLQLIFGFFS